MDTDKILELISVQRHDFINHLQVISGLLQLNKEQRARDYINEVVQEIKRLSQISHLKVPEASAAFLVADNLALNLQVRINYDVQAGLEGCDVPGILVGASLEKLLGYALINFKNPDKTDREININIAALGGGYVCTLQFNGEDNKTPDWDVLYSDLSKKISPYGSKITKTADGTYQKIEFFLPAACA